MAKPINQNDNKPNKSFNSPYIIVCFHYSVYNLYIIVLWTELNVLSELISLVYTAGAIDTS